MYHDVIGKQAAALNPGQMIHVEIAYESEESGETLVLALLYLLCQQKEKLEAISPDSPTSLQSPAMLHAILLVKPPKSLWETLGGYWGKEGKGKSLHRANSVFSPSLAVMFKKLMK